MPNANVSDGYGSDFTFESVLIESDRLNKSVEIKNTTTDLDIYEHLDKPYLTGILTFVDSKSIYNSMDILGAEKVTIRILSTRKDAVPFQKVFNVSKVMLQQKGQENSDTIMLHLIEDVGYNSNLQNINRSYRGDAYTINKKIASNFLDRELVIGNRSPKQSMKLIVPNLSPLEAMIWIKNQAKTSEGLPFYLFSSMTSNNLFMVDLGSLLEEPVINPKYPYKMGAMVAKSNDPNIKRRIIYDYEQKDIDDLFSMIAKGLIGSRYEYIDVLTNRKRTFHFDISKDLLEPLFDKGIAQANQPNFLYTSDYKYKEKSFNKYDSRTISRIGGIDAYREEEEHPYNLALGEGRTTADYKLNVISEAMDQLLKKAPLKIDISGADFIDGDKHSTVGCQLRIEFPISLPDGAIDQPKIDTKKSGDYLVFAARHKFKLEKYDISMSCLKIANYRAQS